ncbi:MAG TPA: hypothetical protein VLI65_01910, partial [Pyrinomonadaceae bacterium]|nr:hypothetical protein [Pyrinomonadaceae bacterium]
MRSKTARLLFLFLAFAATASLSFSQKRNITEKDLFDFTWIGDPQVSPDGSTVAFVKVWVDEKKTGYNTSIWSVSTTDGQMHQLTSGIHDSSPRWSPDGRDLAFVRVTEKDGRPDTPQLFMLPMTGGEAFQFTSMPRGAGGIGWSPNGKWIVFGNSQNAAEVARAGKPAPPSADGHESDVKVITRAGYRSNGAGYLDFTHSGHIWLVAAPRSSEDKVTPRQLTSGNFNEGGAIWAPDSSRIYYTTNRNPEPYYELGTTEVWSVSPTEGPPQMLTK